MQRATPENDCFSQKSSPRADPYQKKLRRHSKKIADTDKEQSSDTHKEQSADTHKEQSADTYKNA